MTQRRVVRVMAARDLFANGMAVDSNGDPFVICSDSLLSIGVSTHTHTTSTLTPTTLKNIEESLYEYSGGIPSAPQAHQHQAGFVPPVVNLNGYQFGSAAITSEKLAHSEESMLDSDDSVSQNGWYDNGDHSDDIAALQTSISEQNNNKTKNKSTSGRRPKNNERLTPEEEERRKVRRERNKQAAARCRKRRLDHTNNLMKETQNLEDKKSALQNELQILKTQREQLQLVLNSHKSECKFLVNGDTKHSRQRPNSLQVSNVYSNAPSTTTSTATDSLGISIQTPSIGIFNLDSLMEGGTGLTPVICPVVSSPSSTANFASHSSASCGNQQRNAGSDTSPDSLGPPKLVSL